MPELPEVESIRLSLEPRLTGRTVLTATLNRRDVVIAPGDPHGGLTRQRGRRAQATRPAGLRPQAILRGCTIRALSRRGKQLAIIADDARGHVSRALIVQLGMSGQLLHLPARGRLLDDTHVHAAWRLDDGSRLVFRDPRRFGALRIIETEAELSAHFEGLGPDALTISDVELARGLAGTRRALKCVLLDQERIAGVGNIYADESLFQAGLSPLRPAASLSDRQIARLGAAIRSVLARAVRAGGSTLRDYRDSSGDPGRFQLDHRVYGRGGEPCTACGVPLRTVTLGQRTTVYCASCQQ